MTPLLTFAVARYLLRVAVLRARIAAAIVLVALVGTIGVGRQNLVGWRRGLTPVTEHFSMCAHVYSTRHAQPVVVVLVRGALQDSGRSAHDETELYI